MIDHRKAMTAELYSAMSKAEESYKNLHPEARNIGAAKSVFAFRRRPKEFAGYPTRMIVMLIQDRALLSASNAVLAKRLSEEMGFKAAPSLLTEKLSARKLAVVAALLTERGINLDLSRHHSLSKIKLALKARAHGEATALRFSGTVLFGEHEIIIGDRAIPVSGGKHRRVHVEGYKLNVDGLKALLCPDPY